MARGTVKWYNPQKGFGFITPDDGSADVFIHVSAVEVAGYHVLEERQRLEYELLEERGRHSAANIRLINAGPE
jgi:CspA family cold shock protein